MSRSARIINHFIDYPIAAYFAVSSVALTCLAIALTNVTAKVIADGGSMTTIIGRGSIALICAALIIPALLGVRETFRLARVPQAN